MVHTDIVQKLSPLVIECVVVGFPFGPWFALFVLLWLRAGSECGFYHKIYVFCIGMNKDDCVIRNGYIIVFMF